jgi:hypothetical protein
MVKMADDSQPMDREFGSGLRAHLGLVEQNAAPAPAPEAVSAPEPMVAEAVEAGADAALERELAGREDRLAAFEAELRAREHRLAEQQASLEATARLLAAKPEEPVRPAPELLRERAEEQADMLWRIFEESLEATRPDGAPDFPTRLLAARELLVAAYGAEQQQQPAPVTGDAAAHADELSQLRTRKAEWGSSL